ncbi:MAG TPA: orotidine-5'-phosphate decarboxylase [Gemmatimonadales bacterium]|nr:orotidine-5'-phosphate decarboxylase [Gemmatimonadales bacterium]
MAEVIVALDLPSGPEAIRLLDRLPEARWVKVGSILMTAEGPDLVRVLADRGLRVFLDLKWHDIPNTVAEAVSAARALGVAMASVHTVGGAAMMAAAAAAAGGRVGIVGVTVLTSHDAASYGQAVGRTGVDLAREAERQSAEAMRSGLAGVVCSPGEVERVRRRLGPDAWIVVPGIRGSSDPRGDQVRVASAADATAAGATHLVVGRPILHAADPAAAFRGFLEEAQCIGS